ncbi:unnamed protein product [Calypogeia fissa]
MKEIEALEEINQELMQEVDKNHPLFEKIKKIEGSEDEAQELMTQRSLQVNELVLDFLRIKTTTTEMNDKMKEDGVYSMGLQKSGNLLKLSKVILGLGTVAQTLEKMLCGLTAGSVSRCPSGEKKRRIE